MTGNSLDAVDAVLCEFDDGRIKDLAFCTKPYPAELTGDIIRLRALIAAHDGDPAFLDNDPFFKRVLNDYTVLTAQTVNALCDKSGIDKADIAAVGWHGQTCDHFPPSVAAGNPPYTLQIADAPRLADLTGLPVIYDFRSDDLMNGGEAAPLAPVHNRHIAVDLRKKRAFPVAFCNAGNTGNIAVISETDDCREVTLGWDAGPFNHFADTLVRAVKGEPCDLNGRYGSRGRIAPDLLSELFDTAALTNGGTNFYLQPPPKSSDPCRYRSGLRDALEKHGFENTLRTVEYLSAYTFFHTLSFIPENVRMPNAFLLFGGGWKNPVILNDFKELLKGNGFVLNRHKALFERTKARFSAPPQVDFSDKYGYSGTYMEARIFADMAKCRITGEPFSFPETTGCKTPTTAGIYVLPQAGGETCLLTRLMEKYQTAGLIKNEWRKKYGRAAKGWQSRL